MELHCSKFDDESKKLIEELAKDSEKFNNLIDKLKTARNTIDIKSKFTKALSEELKK